MSVHVWWVSISVLYFHGHVCIRYLLIQIVKLLLGVGLLVSVGACAPSFNTQDFSTLNSRYTEAEPALSGNGRFLAFVSDRGGQQDLVVYDLQNRSFLVLPRLNRVNTIVASPGLSRTGRYIVYMASTQGRPEIELYDRITQRTERLTGQYRAWVRNPSISPDGRYVTFETARRGQWDIEILDRGNIELDLAQGDQTITAPLEN